MKQILKNIGAVKVIPLTTHLCLLYTCIMQKVSSQVIVKHWTFVIQKSRRDAFFKSLIGVGTKKKTTSSIVVGYHHHSTLKH